MDVGTRVSDCWAGSRWGWCVHTHLCELVGAEHREHPQLQQLRRQLRRRPQAGGRPEGRVQGRVDAVELDELHGDARAAVPAPERDGGVVGGVGRGAVTLAAPRRRLVGASPMATDGSGVGGAVDDPLQHEEVRRVVSQRLERHGPQLGGTRAAGVHRGRLGQAVAAG